MIQPRTIKGAITLLIIILTTGGAIVHAGCQNQKRAHIKRTLEMYRIEYGTDWDTWPVEIREQFRDEIEKR